MRRREAIFTYVQALALIWFAVQQKWTPTILLGVAFFLGRIADVRDDIQGLKREIETANSTLDVLLHDSTQQRYKVGR
jgi:hypothetical protein